MSIKCSLAVTAAALFTPLAAQGATVSNLSTLPGGVNIDITGDEATVSGSGAGTQARYRNGGGDIRGAVQTFTWNTSAALDGFGLLFDDAQGSFDPFNQSQQYNVQVDLLDEDNRDEIETTIALIDITIEPGDVSPSSAGSPSYFFVDFDTDLALVNGRDYAFHLFPDATQTPPGDVNQRLYFAETAAGSYDTGFGRQTAGTLFVAGQEYPQPGGGFEGTDLAFFTVAVPEPSSLALVGLGGLAILRRNRTFA